MASSPSPRRAELTGAKIVRGVPSSGRVSPASLNMMTISESAELAAATSARGVQAGATAQAQGYVNTCANGRTVHSLSRRLPWDIHVVKRITGQT